MKRKISHFAAVVVALAVAGCEFPKPPVDAIALRPASTFRTKVFAANDTNYVAHAGRYVAEYWRTNSNVDAVVRHLRSEGLVCAEKIGSDETNAICKARIETGFFLALHLKFGLVAARGYELEIRIEKYRQARLDVWSAKFYAVTLSDVNHERILLAYDSGELGSRE